MYFALITIITMIINGVIHKSTPPGSLAQPWAGATIIPVFILVSISPLFFIIWKKKYFQICEYDLTNPKL